MRFTATLSFFFILVSATVFAQTGEVRGFVYDKKTGEPVMFAHVVLAELIQGTTTDTRGFFTITRVPVGTYTLKSSFIGYDTASATIIITEGRITTQNFHLEEGSIMLDAVEVTDRRSELVRESRVSITSVSPREISQLPSIGGEPDIAQYLQILPGVVSSGDQGGQLYIRGGSPIQNKALLDGMTIYNPFHSIGFYSVFDVDIIRTTDIYTGGFGAEHGGRISSIIDVKTRDGNRRRFGGVASASPFAAKLLLEGPIKPLKENEASSSVLFTTRGSYLKQTAPLLYGYASEDGLPYNFLDMYGKYSWLSPDGSRINLFGFNFNDQVTYPVTTYQWNAAGGGTSIMLIPEGSNTVIEGTFSYSSYSMNQTVQNELPRSSEINNFDAGIDFTYYVGHNQVKYGFDITGFKTNFDFFNPVGRRITQTNFTTELAGYIHYRAITGRWVFDPGFRAHYYASLQEFSPEPRLAVKYNLSEKVRFKYAGGFYTQNLISAQSEKDVVNLFYGFLSGPDQMPAAFDGRTITSRLQKANHNILGVEFDLGQYSHFNVEGYLKNFTQLTSLNRDKIFDNTREFFHHPAYQRQDFIIETGKAYGIDFLYRFERSRYYLWAAYSHSFVTRDDGIREYYPHWDRRHNLNLMGTLRFGANNTWEFTTRWNFGTGFPFTRTRGMYELLDFSGGLYTDYTTTNGQLGILYEDVNLGRLPYFHRLDISLKKEIKFSDTRNLAITANVVNAYDRENIFYFDRVSYSRINQLPILPSIGVNYRF